MELYKGFPLTAKDTLEDIVEQGRMHLVQPIEGDFYQLDEPGIYSCHIEEENSCHELRIFHVEKEDLQFHLGDKFKPKSLTLNTDGTEDGWQPTGKPALARENFRRDQRDMMLCIWPDEILQRFGGDEEPTHHQVLTQEALMKQMHSMNQQCPYMQVYSLGKTKNLDMDIPLAVFSTGEEQKFRDKLTVWYQAQVHGNEPAACDGALEIMRRMIEQPEYRNLLEHINLLVIPRANPESAYLYRRMNYDSINLNRDHMAEDAWETQMLHREFQKYQPEVVLDGHEFISYEMEECEAGTVTKRGWDVMTSPATSLNINPQIRDISLDICEAVFKKTSDAEIKINHFGTTSNNAIGRTCFGLHHSLSFLIETRGIGAGRYCYDYRIKGQVTTVATYLQEIADRAEEIKAFVRRARSAENKAEALVLHQEASGKKLTPYCGTDCRYTLDGILAWEKQDYMSLQDTVLRQRTMPKGYLLSAGLEDVEKILSIMDNQGIRFEKYPAGTKINVQRYISLGQRPDSEIEDDILADLLPAEEITFDEEVYFFSTDQRSGMVLAMLMEPDVTDSAGSRGTLFQQGLAKCKDIYRII